MTFFSARSSRLRIVLALWFVQFQAFGAEPAMTSGTTPEPLSQGSLHKLEAQGAQVSALVVNLNSGKILAHKNPQQLLTPASVTKLILGAAVLERWGSSYAFESALYYRGGVQGGVLKGDLIFRGAGDPSLTNEKIWYLTSDPFRQGIKKVTGRLVINDHLFKVMNNDSNREAGQQSSTHAYDSPLSAAALNFSVFAAVVSPADRAGLKATVSLEPFLLPSVRIVNEIVTQKFEDADFYKNNAEIKKKIMVKRVTNKGVDTLYLKGAIPLGSPPVRIYRSTSDANRYAAEVLLGFLKQQGVQVLEGYSVETSPPHKNEQKIAAVEGYPIDWQLRGLFKVSNNFIADMFTLWLVADSDKSQKSVTLSEGNKALARYTQQATEQCALARSAQWGTPYRQQDINSFIFASGSGLTPENKLSSLHVVCVLQKMFQNSREFPAFLAALPVPGAEGTVKRRFRRPGEYELRDRLRAKTGTLTQPIDAVGLAGYTRLHNGDWAAFSVMVNGSVQNPHLGVDVVRDAIDADLANVLGPE